MAGKLGWFHQESEYTSDMKQLESQFKVLRDQAIVLRQTFNTFNHLFESDSETDRVLKESAAWFFYDLNRMMVEYLILLVCRLTDPPETLAHL